MKKSTFLPNLLFVVFIFFAQASFGVTNYWNGGFNTYWHNNNNWSLGHIPLASEDVVITTIGQIPLVDYYDEVCKSLTINSSATLRIADQTLTVSNAVDVYGTLELTNTAAKLYCTYMTWRSGSTGIMTGSSVISLSRNWQFSAGANVQLTSGYVDFTGTIASYITSKDVSCHFNHIRNFKSGTYLAHSSASTEDILIDGNLYMYSGSELRSFSSLRITLSGFLNNLAGSIHMDNGIFQFQGGTTTNNLVVGDYFNQVIINSTGTTTIADPLTIKSYLWIVQGGLNTNNNTITVGGNWSNSVGPTGFTEGTGRVIFNGTGHQYINQYSNQNEEFNILEVNKTGGAVRVDNPAVTVYCASYDWTAGAVDILQGTFTAASLADNGIAGTWYLNYGGEINLTNTTGYVDLLGDLTIYGGTMNIYGGIDDSYWPYGSAGSSIAMTGGILDFKETGIYVQSTGSLTENITGGNIKTSGNLRLQRTDFTPTNSIFTMHGTENAYIRLDAGSINQLDVAKTTAKTNSLGNAIPDYLPSKQEEGLSSPVIDTEYFTNSASIQTNSQIIKKPRDGSQKSPKVIGDVVTPYADVNLNHIVVYSGTFNPDNHTVTLAGDMWVFGELEMISFWDEIEVRDLKWYAGSTTNINTGNIKVNRDFWVQIGSNVQFGGLNVVSLIGSGDQEITNGDPGTEIGTLMCNNTIGELGFWTELDSPITVTGDMTVNAANSCQITHGGLIVDGILDIGNTASMVVDIGTSLTNNSDFNLSGNLFVNGDAFFHNNFDVFGELTINGSLITDNQTEWIAIYGTLNLSNNGLFEIVGSLIIPLGSTNNITGGIIRLSGHIQALYSNTFQPAGGSLEFFGPTANSIRMIGSNHFYNLIINNDPGVITDIFENDIKIKNDFTINSGIFRASDGTTSYNIEVGGNWTNNVGDAGFLEELSTVTLNGTVSSTINSTETFYNLICNKSVAGGNDVIFIDSDKSANVLNNLDIIDGVLWVTTSSTLDVRGNLSIGPDALLNGPNFFGSIYVGGNWTNNNIENSSLKGFFPGGSTVVFNGLTDQTLTTNAPFEGFNGVEINKFNGSFITNDNTEVAGNFLIQSGVWRGSIAGLTHTFYGSFTVEADGVWESFSPNYNTVVFTGTANQSFTWNNDNFSEGYLTKVIVDKSAKSNKSQVSNIGEPNKLSGSNNKAKGGTLTLMTNLKSMSNESRVTINSGTLNLNGDTLIAIGSIEINPGGILIAPAGSNIRVGHEDTLHVNGGELYAFGTGTSKVLYSCSNGWYTNFIVDNGGFISAEHTIFRDLMGSGLFIDSDGFIDPLSPLNNCEFTIKDSYYSPPNSCLTINNNQNLTIDSVYFNFASIGGEYNVTKDIDLGTLLFTNAYGYYAGPAFENDTYSRIDWTGFTPGQWTGSFSTDWNDYRNWDNLAVPDASVDVVIPAGVPNYPEVNSANQFCNNLEISLSASLTIGDNALSVSGNFVNHGILTMNNSAGSLNVSQHILWMANSNANADLGTISVGGDWFFYNGTDSQLGAANTTVFNGSNNQSIYCYDANASFGSVIIDKPSNAVLIDNFSTDTIRINGDFNVETGNIFHVQNNQMIVNGEISLSSSSSTYIQSEGSITCNSDFYLFGSLNINNGNVNLYGVVYLGTVSGLTIDGGSFLILNNLTTPIRTTLGILNDGVFQAHSIDIITYGSINMSSGLINLSGNFWTHIINAFQPTGGAVEFTGSQVSTVNFFPGNYFHDLTLNMTGQVHLASDISIKNDLNIDNGGLYGFGNTIVIGGNWNNMVGAMGFEGGLGTVKFNGNGNNQNVTAETFYNVQQDYVSTGSNLLFLGSTTVLNNITLNYRTWINDVFDVQGNLDISNPTSIFTANNNGIATIANLVQGGTMNMNGGTVTVTDLAENGIYGSINVVSGELNYSQDASSYVDLNCNLSMSGGTFNINSSINNSLWAFDGDASVSMSGGILNFNNCGILIQDNANVFTENITGGTIRTNGIFKANRSQFTPSGGTIEMFGGADVEIATVPGANLYNVLINKSGGKQTNSTYKDREGNMVKAIMGNVVNVISDIPINGNLTIDAGHLYDYSHSISCLGNVNINNSGLLSIDANATLALDNLKTLSVNSGGTLSVMGNAGNEAKITHLSGYYGFNIENGGNISAEYGIFEFMYTNGVYLKPGSLIDPIYPFNHCLFREGISGGRLMTDNTENVFTVTDAIFPTNTWGSTHNVYKSANIGNVYFVGSTGGFAGDVYEYDPYNHIHWSDHILTLDLTVNLEGPFSGTNMNTTLNAILPLSQPYNISPWNYTGTESVSAIPNTQAVDWVIVEGRDAPTAALATIATRFERQAAFLLSDGSVVGMDGSSPIQFTHSLVDQFYIVILHRNHLGIISANPLTNPGGFYTYDFTTGNAQAFGTNAQKDLGSGVYGMFSGDANADENIDGIDKTIWENQTGTQGHKSADFDLDGYIDNRDKNENWVSNEGVGGQLPQ